MQPNVRGEEAGTPSASFVADKCLETPVQSVFFLEFLGWREVELSPRLRMVWVGKLCVPCRRFYTGSTVYPVSAPLASCPGSSSKLLGCGCTFICQRTRRLSVPQLYLCCLIADSCHCSAAPTLILSSLLSASALPAWVYLCPPELLFSEHRCRDCLCNQEHDNRRSVVLIS